MRIRNYKDYARFDYESSKSTTYQLGDVVINCDNEIGIIIQIHADGDFRTDMFGNACASEIRMATNDEIRQYRPGIETEVHNFTH